MKKFNIRPWGCLLVLLACLCGMVACSSESSTDDTTVPPSDTQSMYLSLSLSQISVKSDNSDSAMITATVLDGNRLPVAEAMVSFSANGGQLTSVTDYAQTTSGVATDEIGLAKINFSSGTVEKRNQVVTVTAQVAGTDLIQTIPIQVTGTTVSIEAANTSLEIDGDDTTACVITVKDAGGTPINDAHVEIIMEAASTGAVMLSAATGQTDVNGILNVNVTGAVRGTAMIRVNALGATAVQSFQVDSASEVFSIIRPSVEAVSLSTGTTLRVIVSNPNPGERGQVVFSTTFGRWSGTGGAISTIVDVDSDNQAMAHLVSDEAGVATIEVYDIDTPAVKDRLTVAISAPPEEAAKISLQASARTLPPTTTQGVTNSITLYATVRNANDQVVGNAPVQFFIENPTGGGEFISPVVVFTNDSGVAETKLTSGSLSSDTDGIQCLATVLGSEGVSGMTSVPVDVIIGGTGSSLAIGIALVTATPTETAYSTPCSVLVSDSAGNPVAGAEVTLKLWPTHYTTGYWNGETAEYTYYTKESETSIVTRHGGVAYPNEDANRNLILDGLSTINGEDSIWPYEDGYPTRDYEVTISELQEDGTYKDVIVTRRAVNPGHGNELLTPALSTAGSVPSVVTTDENGMANFDHLYLRNYAVWLEVQIEASAVVYGTETKTTHRRWLEFLESDKKYLKDSPFNPDYTGEFVD